ncbi:uncharacterized protein LOC120289119 [Eucalyptus grandis]|uniref:uncharacterized protein LOC120289119 n=1 Tax=Eucalyptus grandis TaxID=71139 RepID=UPI00192E7E85|nr:uncharacterized protein LOC120289119 [Eucalyptus grandis]
MGGPPLLFGMLCFLGVMTIGASAGKAACHDPFFGQCYGILHTCPAACPRLCEVDCRLCKPYCACDRPGAVCQDPRFIGGDGVMFYFHGKKDKDFCLVSDPSIHINAHFIGKSSSREGTSPGLSLSASCLGPISFISGHGEFQSGKSWRTIC